MSSRERTHRANHAMERTATPCAIRVCRHANPFAPIDARSRRPSLIFVSLDGKVRSLILKLFVALVVASVAVFFGMVLPGVTDFEIHNPLWELIFGIGFGLSELFHIGMRGDALIGFLLWPAFIFVAVSFSAFYTLHRSRRTRLVVAVLFVLSLFICVSRATQNSIALHVPLWSNEYFVRY